MALTLENFTGFETGGLDEAGATAGSPSVQSTTKRTGTYALLLPGGAGAGNNYSISVADTGGTGHVVGLGVRFADTTPSTEGVFFRAIDNGGIVEVALTLATNGDLKLRQTGSSGGLDGTILLTVTAPFIAGQFYYIELFWQHTGSGAWELFIDGVSVGSGSGADFVGGAGTLVRYNFVNLVDDVYFDDFYAYSGATAATDRLGNGLSSPWVEVTGPYQNTAEDATDQGDALEVGTWATASNTPGDDTGAAIYSSTPRAGSTITDEGTRLGPVSDTRFTYGTIKAAKWIHRLSRGGGGGTTHNKLYGNSGDGVTTTAVSLTTSAANFTTISELATVVPTTSESFQHGFGVSGAQDILCEEIWAFLLQTRSSAPPDTNITPTPVTIPLVVTTPAVTIIQIISPSAVAVPLVVAQPTVTKTLVISPTAIAIPVVTAAPTIAQTLTISPDIVAIPLVVPAPTITVVTIGQPTRKRWGGVQFSGIGQKGIW